MIFYRYWEFKDDFLKKAFEDINSIGENNSLVFIHLDSGWWEGHIRDHLLFTLKRLSKDKNITIVVSYVASFAFDMLYNLKDDVNIQILDWAYAVIHKSIWEVKVEAWWTLSNVDKYKMEFQKNIWFCYDFLTSEEKQKYDKWEDVVLGQDRLNQVFSKKY